MKKFSAAILLLFLVSSAAATNIESETVTVDLEESTVEAEVVVTELTQTVFTYITAYPKEDVNVQINGEPQDCELNTLSIGSEIRCHTDERENFTVNVKFTTDDIVTPIDEAQMFQYTYSVYRPTDEYNFKVILPEGAGLIDEDGTTTPAISPDDYTMDSESGRISLSWTTDPRLGETLDYRVIFNTNTTTSYTAYLVIFGLLALVSGSAYFYWRKRNRELLESFYDELTEGQIQVLELIRDNDGRMLQKDIVNQTEYSKAKISGVVSELVEEDLVEKTKEGRSNQIRLSKKLSF